MAEAAATDDLTRRRRRQSMDFLPPFMSVVLVGNSSSERRKVGNFILGRTKFTKKKVRRCESVTGKWRETELVVINTPDLLHPEISEEELREHGAECERLTGPGPHVFLLVLQPEDFTQQQNLKLRKVLQLLGDGSFDHSMVLITARRTKGSGGYFGFPSSPGWTRRSRDVQPEKVVTEKQISALIRRCGDRSLRQENLDHEDLLIRLSQSVKKENKELKPPLTLVLCGRRGAGKTSAAEAFLGPMELQPSSECVKHQGQVCGRPLSLLELPALGGKPLEAAMEESWRSISLCEPEGVHAFILVLPVAPVTDEDKGELQTIQKIFGPQVNDFTMILFTTESDPTDPDEVKPLRDSPDIQELCESCGGRSAVLNIRDQQQVSEVLDTVEKMSSAGRRCYKKDTFTEVQVKRVVEHENSNTNLAADLEKRTRWWRNDDKDLNKEPLRLMLTGKSGSGKSSAANTILGKSLFKKKNEPKKNRTSKKASAEVGGRPVTVVTTGDLLDTTVSDQVLKQELHKSLGMLSPGPHVFILVLQIGNITPEEQHAVERIKKYFGKEAVDFTMIVFTGGDKLQNKDLESYLKESDCDFVKTLMRECGGRFLVFNNKDHTNPEQAQTLLTRVQTMVKEKGGCCYKMNEDTQTLTQVVETLLTETERMKRNEEELKRKHGGELNTLRQKIQEQKEKTDKERQQRTEQLREKDLCINKLHEEQEEARKRWKGQEEQLREDCRKHQEAAERMVKAEKRHEELITALSQSVKKENKELKPPLTLVLCGRRGAGKTSAAEAFLGPMELQPSSECVKHQGQVCGRPLSLLELPALGGKPLEAAMEESWRSISLCEPEGVHAFILVLPVAPVTDQDKEELKTIQKIFGPQVNNFTMILLTTESDPTDPDEVKPLRDSPDIQELCESCGGRSAVLNIRDQQHVSEVLDTVEKMKHKNKPSYTTETFTQAQITKIIELEKHVTELKKFQNKGQSVGAAEKPNTESLRIVLIGKTGNGKSSCGNTILGRQEFKSDFSQKSVTKYCQKSRGEVDGRPVFVVDTPGLFDNSLSNEEINEEMKKCISLLAPGPHVFLLVVQIGRFTPEDKETLELIKQAFGKNSENFTIVLLTKGDELEQNNLSIREFVNGKCDDSFKKLIRDCGGRFHVFNNKDRNNHGQVRELINKIDSMVTENGGNGFTNEMLEEAEAVIKKETERILKENEDMKREMEELRRRNEEEMQEMKRSADKQREETEHERKLRETQLKEMKEKIEKEKEKRRKEQEERERDDRKKKEQEEKQRGEFEEKRKSLEEKIESESKAKETTNEKLLQSREEMKKEQEDWEKERKTWWSKRESDIQDSKRQAEEKELQNQYEQKAREENERRQKEEDLRKEQEEMERKKFQEKHQKDREKIRYEYEVEARKQAEELNALELEKEDLRYENRTLRQRGTCPIS